MKLKRLSSLRLACGAVLLLPGLPTVASAAGVDRSYVTATGGEKAAPKVAVDNVCAWPNLTVLGNGSIVATIFNQPSHGQMEGDVACHASDDGGKTWRLRGVPARHEPGTNRMNVAAGRAGNGDLIVVASGWSDAPDPGEKPRHKGRFRGAILSPWICRSTDGGKTWSVDRDAFPVRIPNGYKCVPFGDIVAGKDGALRVAVYSSTKDGSRTYIYRSPDDGRTWEKPVPLDENAGRNETALYHLGDGKWLAATRGAKGGLHLHASKDDAASWESCGQVTQTPLHPGHLLRLRDGRLLLTYGNRTKDAKGVDVRFSKDEGTTWSEPVRVTDFDGDGGYPSSVQRPDGQVVTAYYAQKSAGHNRYHMGVVIWDPVVSTKR